jgi:hypothetical protein
MSNLEKVWIGQPDEREEAQQIRGQDQQNTCFIFISVTRKMS